MNPLLKLLAHGHYGVKLPPEDWSRLVTWMDTLGQRSGSFSAEQEARLRKLKQSMAEMIESDAGSRQPFGSSPPL